MEIWFKNDGIRFLTTMAVTIVSCDFSEQFKL